MRVVFLVPWRTDDGPRAKAWALCRRRWEALFPDWPIYEGSSPEGPFQRSKAINNAAKKAGAWDVAVIIDADVLLPKANVAEAVKRAAATGKVTWAHRRWRDLSQEATERLTGPKGDLFAEGALGKGGIEAPKFTADIDLLVTKTTRLSWSCCIAIRRDAWDRIGGFDERFIGWGHEDGAFMAVTGAFVGWDRIEGDVLNLWHPRPPGAGVADKYGPKRYTPQALVNGRLGMRYAIALRRDHQLTDRPDPSSAEVLARDIANLRKMDQEFAAQQHPDARRKYDDWWPTLEELNEGAKAFAAANTTGSVTVVVMSGGASETWPERSAYLRRSLPSLNKQIRGPVVQRVIYSGWDEEHQAALEAIAAEHGFYVVGGGNHGHTGTRQRMWSYLRKRAAGEYIFQSEDDFIFPEPVELEPMIETLQDDANLAQIALLRDAFYQDERETGGVLGWPEPAFTKAGTNGNTRLEHRLFWTNNPALYRKALTARPWPTGRHSETIFGKHLLADAKVRFAFWGDHAELTRHIGEVRAGTGY